MRARTHFALARVACALLLVAVSAALLAEMGAVAQSEARAGASSSSEIDPRRFVRVLLPPAGPLELVHLDYGSSRVTRSERGMLMDLNLRLTVRNRSAKPIEGMALALRYGFGTPGTGGLNAVSGIRLAPGETYAVPARMHVEIELPPRSSRARPVDLPTSVRLRLDSVLFADGSAYGPDRMRVLSTMRINRAESARDRRFLQGLLETAGLPRLIPLLERWAPDVARAGPGSAEDSPRVLAGLAAERARALAQAAGFHVVRFPDAPLEIVWGRARIYESGLVDPALGVRNLTRTGVADFQVAWLLRDASGKAFRAATISASGRKSSQRGLPLAAGGSLRWSNQAVLETGPAASRPILAGRVYLRAVEFTDGSIWVPERAHLVAAGLEGALPPSSEMIRLLRFYKVRGPQAFTAELGR